MFQCTVMCVLISIPAASSSARAVKNFMLLERVNCKHETGTDVSVRVAGCVVTIPIEQPVVLILVIVTANVEHNTGRRMKNPKNRL